MKKKLLLVFIVLVILIFLGLYFLIIKDEGDVEVINKTDFSIISECNEYLGEECSLEFENVSLKDENVKITYRIYLNEEEEAIELLVNDLSIFNSHTTGDLKLYGLDIIEDLVFINVSTETEDYETFYVGLMDKLGGPLLEYNGFLDLAKISGAYIDENNLIINTSKETMDNTFDFYPICDPDLYSMSGYNADTIARAEYKIEYSDGTFSEPNMIDSTTLGEVITEVCE